MNKYRYKAKDRENNIVKGIIYTESKEELRKILESKKYYLIKSRKLINLTNINKKTNLSDFVFLCNQISIMLDAGLEFDKVMNILKDTVRKTYLKEILERIYLDIKNGEAINVAFSKYKIFPQLFINMLKIGEASGKIEYVFKNIKTYYEETKKSKNKIKSALSYPVFLLSVGVLVMILLMYKIVPIFSDIFSHFNSELPMITKVMISFSNHMRKNGYIYLIVLLIIYITLKLFTRAKKGKLFVDSLKIKIFIIKKIYLYFYTYLITYSLELLLISGSTLVESIDIVKDILGNNYLENKIENVSLEVKSGLKLSISLRKMSYFPYELIEMISIGEISGKLTNVLKIMCTYYDAEYKEEINKLTKKIEPIMILVIGILLMIMLLGLFLPILGIMDSVSSRV